MQIQINPNQARIARRELGLSQNQVSTAIGVNRVYFSDFENEIANRLTHTQLKKLRTYYEEKIAEANANGEQITLTFGEAEDDKPAASVETFSAKRLTFQVADEVSDATFVSTLSTISENDKKLVEVLTTSLTRDSALFGEGELSKGTLEALREAFSRLTANYLLIRSITGWPQLGLSASNINPATDSILGLVMSEVNQSFKNAGLIVDPQVSENGEGSQA